MATTIAKEIAILCAKSLLTACPDERARFSRSSSVMVYFHPFAQPAPEPRSPPGFLFCGSRKNRNQQDSSPEREWAARRKSGAVYAKEASN